MCWTWGRESCTGVRKPAERMHEWREARAVARLKLRASQKIVNAGLQLKILSDSRADRSASRDRAAVRLVIEMKREVALNAEMLIEVPYDRSLKSLSLEVSAHTCIRSKANYPTAGFTESGVTCEKFKLGMFVRGGALRRNQEGRTQQKCSTERQANEQVLISSFH